MSSYQKPVKWQNPKVKLFPHQVGFTCPPHDFDAGPSDFLRMAPRTVGVHGWMLHVPDYAHRLDQRKQNFDMLEDFVHNMANNGVDVCGQIRAEALSDAAGDDAYHHEKQGTMKRALAIKLS